MKNESKKELLKYILGFIMYLKFFNLKHAIILVTEYFLLQIIENSTFTNHLYFCSGKLIPPNYI
jgi:hypothetical protein